MGRNASKKPFSKFSLKRTPTDGSSFDLPILPANTLRFTFMTMLVKSLVALSAALALLTLLPAPAAGTVALGIDVLESRQFRELQGKRVGLLTHPAGVNRRGESTIDVLRRAPQVNLVALFGPEHGIYGNERASQPIDDQVDERTGLPVYSLYGRYRRPTPEMLERIDVLVIDLQDVGVRSYTFVSAMRYAMEACFSAGVEVVVLDRPNPLGGLKADGPPLDEEWMSYVGAFRVPYVHGLTIGELARISKARPGWLQVPDQVRRDGQLTVVPMRGWERHMMWPETGLKWIPTSPNIPDLSSVLGYAMTGLGQMHSGFSHGIGTPYPFRLLRHSSLEPEALRDLLRQRRIPGLDYRIVETRTAAGAPIRGVYPLVSDWESFRPTEISFHMMVIGTRLRGSNPYRNLSHNEMDLFNKHVGSTGWWNEIRSLGDQARLEHFIDRWQAEAKTFQEATREYWLYR